MNLSNMNLPRMRKNPWQGRPFSDVLLTWAIILFALLSLMALAGCGGSSPDAIPQDLVERLPEPPDLSNVEPALQTRVSDAMAIASSDAPTVDSVRELSRLYHANGYLQEAMVCYELLLELDPENPRWKHLFSFLLATYGYADDAEMLWRETLALDPSYIPARIRLADVMLKSNRIEEAAQVYAEVHAMDSRNPYALLGLGRVAIASQDWQAAREHLEASSRYSDGKIGRDLLVTALENMGEVRLAEVIRGEAKASGSFVDIPDPWLADVMTDCYDPAQLMNMGGLAAFAGDVWGGIEWSKRALELDPDNAGAHFQIGQMYFQSSQLNEAMRHFQLATQYRPDFSDAWLKQVEIEERRGNADAAEDLFYRGFMKCPQSPAYNLHYAMRLMKSGERKQAMAYLKKSIELNPNEAPAYIQLASNYFGLDRIEEGREALETALRVEPGNRLAMLTLCYYYISKKDRDNAQKWLDAIEIHPRIGGADKLELKLKFQEVF